MALLRRASGSSAGPSRPPRRHGAPRRPAGAARPPSPPPSLLLWRHRHLIVAVCLGAAAVLALSVLRPSAPAGVDVLVVARPVGAGEVLEEADLAWREVPGQAVPGQGLAGEEVIGARAAVALEEGTVLTTSMTSSALTVGLAPTERLVQVQVDVGADLAQPGARVDLIGERPASSASSVVESDAGADAGADAGTGTGTDAGPESGAVLCSGARVVLVQTEGSQSQWTAGTKVTLVTVAVNEQDASLVVQAATSSSLGIVLSP